MNLSEEDPLHSGASRHQRALLKKSWRANASAWTDAVRCQRIASRRVATDAAIIEAVLATSAHRVLDVGCGEGWLARALAARGCEVVGIDASPALIDSARDAGGGRFETMDYSELAECTNTIGRFDSVVFNFALLDDDLATPLRAARSLLNRAGALVVQTVHPWTACGDARYADGWRTEDFATFDRAFAEPMPWYFRTLSSWLGALAVDGFAVDRVHEPLDPDNGRPLSLLMIARVAD